MFAQLAKFALCILVVGQEILAETLPLADPVVPSSDSIARDSPVTRTQSSPRRGSKEAVSFYELPIHIVREISGDPIALVSSLLLIGFYIGQILLAPRKDAKAATGPASGTPPTSRKTSRAEVLKAEVPKPSPKPKSSEMVSFNQSLTKCETVAAVLDLASKQPNVDTVNVVTAIHRSTKLALQSKRTKALTQDERFVSLVRQLHKMFDEDMQAWTLTRAVGNTSWALAKLQYRDHDNKISILDVLHHNFSLYAEKFKPEELMNTVWAFAELCREGKDSSTARAVVVARAAARCANEEIVNACTTQQQVYFTWALARLADINAVRNDVNVQSGFATYKALLVTALAGHTEALTSKHLAMLSWAISHMQKFSSPQEDVEKLLNGIGEDVLRRGTSAFLPGELASILGAFSKVQVKDSKFQQALQAQIMQDGCHGYTSQDLTTIICGFINLECTDEAFYIKMADIVQHRALDFNRLERQMLKRSFARVQGFKGRLGCLDA
jgi:hypothetical protein